MADRVPQLLPPDVTHFTARETELATLDALLATPTPAVVITAIAGTAGMGKTSLAVHWAHRVRDHFPDGQLYVNLRGYDPGPALSSEQALDGFLRALNVPGEVIPHGGDAMSAYYRSLVAGRRMLVVLDNAATAEQVRPLLPASENCVVLVTSRSRLSGLVARDGARRITLDLLPPDEAITLLRTIIGPDPALPELAQRCAYLPLALRIAAERVTARPNRPIADLVADLTAEQARLDILSADDDEITAVRAVFSWSYRALPPAAARLFRLLGLHPGPDISVSAAAALADTTPDVARRQLDTLASVHLLEETGPDRYAFHDLLRAYASELATTEEPIMERDSALDRMFQWYLHTAHAASRIVHPYLPHKPIGPVGPDCHPLTFASNDEGLAWFDDERANLMALIQRAADIGWASVAVQLPIVIGVLLNLRYHLVDLIAVNRIALANVPLLQDDRATWSAHIYLAAAYRGFGRYQDAIRHNHDALAIAHEIEDRRYEMGAQHDLALSLQGLGQIDLAMLNFEQALAGYREVGDRWGEGTVLSLISDCLRQKGRLDEALDYAQRGLVVMQEINYRWTEAFCLRLLSQLYVDLHRLPDAIEALRQAQNMLSDFGDCYDAARTLQDLGEAHRRAGDPGKARECWEEALGVFEALNSPRVAEVRARLDALSG